MVVMFTMLAYGKQSYGYTYVVVTRFGRYVNLLQSRALFLGALETPSGRSGNSDALMISLSCLTWSLLLCLGACTPLDFHVWYIERQVFFWSSALFPALEFHSSAWTSGRNIAFSVRCILHTPWMINPKTTHSLDSPSRILTGKAKFPWKKKKEKKTEDPHSWRYHEPPLHSSCQTSLSVSYLKLFQRLGGYSIARAPRAPPGLKWWHRMIIAQLNTWSNEPISPIDIHGCLRGGASTTYMLLNQNR